MTFKKNIKIWKRSRDDIYILWNGGEEAFDCFFWRVNYIDPRIQFTIERENNRVLPFLDMSLKRYPNKIETKIYRKETHSKIYPLEIKPLKKLQTWIPCLSMLWCAKKARSTPGLEVQLALLD